MWLRNPHETTESNQQKALKTTFLITKKLGPTLFELIKPGENANLMEQGKNKTVKCYKVRIGSLHTCTCKNYGKYRIDSNSNGSFPLCIHICWILLKYFRLNIFDELSWQNGLVEREIEKLLITKEQNQVKKQTSSSQSDDQNSKETEEDARSISVDDVCPICQESLLSNPRPTSHCCTCKQNLHLHCMKIWIDHQNIGNNGKINCPMCRNFYGDIQDFRKIVHQQAHDKMTKKEESSSTTTRYETSISKKITHINHECSNCQTNPIRGRIYKCNDQSYQNYFLCAACFTSGVQPGNSHSDDFSFKVYRDQKNWKPARKRFKSNDNSMFSTDRQAFYASTNDRDVLLQLDDLHRNNLPAYDIPADYETLPLPDHLINNIPSFKIKSNSKLLVNKKQCMICLKNFAVNNFVRKLACSHYFHRECIDGFLSEDYKTCPICGGEVLRSQQKKQQRNEERDEPFDFLSINRSKLKQISAKSRRDKILAAIEKRNQGNSSLPELNFNLSVTSLQRSSNNSPQIPKKKILPKIFPNCNVNQIKKTTTGNNGPQNTPRGIRTINDYQDQADRQRCQTTLPLEIGRGDINQSFLPKTRQIRPFQGIGRTLNPSQRARNINNNIAFGRRTSQQQLNPRSTRNHLLESLHLDIQGLRFD